MSRPCSHDAEFMMNGRCVVCQATHRRLWARIASPDSNAGLIRSTVPVDGGTPTANSVIFLRDKEISGGLTYVVPPGAN